MINDRVKELALANGFKLKQQPDGSEDLNPYVYDFARALLADTLADPDRATVAERRAFYEEHLRNPNTHGAMAFELSFLRVKLDRQVETSKDTELLDWLIAKAQSSYTGVTLQHYGKSTEGDSTGYRVMSFHDMPEQIFKDARAALRDAKERS